jgi:hypothetical protein
MWQPARSVKNPFLAKERRESGIRAKRVEQA